MAGPGSGLASSFGTGVETAGSYGTQATATKWMTVDSAELKRNPVYVEGNGLRNGALARDTNERVLTNQDAGGSVKMNFYHQAMGQLIGSLMGNLGTAPAQIASTTAYTQTGAFANSWHQSLTIQQGITDVSQTQHDWLILGAKVTEGQFECGAGSALTSTFTIDAQDRFESGTAITAPSFIAANPFFTFADMTVKIGTFGSEAKVDGVTKWTGNIKRMQSDKRFNAGNFTTNPSLIYGIKDEPVDNNFADIGGTLETEYLNDTLFENYFMTEVPFSLIVTFTSVALAGAGNPFSVVFAFPNNYFTGTDPTITGPDIVKPSMPFKTYLDETHPAATITIISKDTTQ
jgi:hypothetical protein